MREFGAVEGMQLYLRLKSKRLGWFKSSKKNINFFLRNNITDPGIFGQVFIDRQYDYPYNFKPKNIIDAGANIGLASLYFANKFPQANIVSLEPDKENYEMALQNTRDCSKVKMLQKGIWHKQAFLEIIDSNVSNDAFMVQEVEALGAGSIEAIDINTIMQQEGWSNIDILKIDIEGSEKEVFGSNYETWLPRTKVIFVEVHDDMKQGSSKAVFKAISQYNFSFAMKHENLVFTNQDL